MALTQMKLRSYLLNFNLLFGIFLFCAAGCRSAGSVSFERYAGKLAEAPNGYLSFYAAAIEADLKTETETKRRNYFLAAMAEPDTSLNCASWDCFSKTLSEIKEAKRSPLYPFAIFHLAEIANHENEFAEGLKLLALIDAAPPPLMWKASLLKGSLLKANGAERSLRARHWKAHASDFDDAASLYYAAHGFYLSGNSQDAQRLSWLALEKPEADFPFAQSGLLLRNILGAKIDLWQDTHQKIRLMEALRVGKDKSTAMRLFTQLRKASIPPEDALLFASYAARLLIDKKDFRNAAHFVNEAGLAFFADANESAALDICERFLKKKQYPLVRSLYKIKTPTKASEQCLLREAQRSSSFTATNRAIALEYLKNFDGASTLAERIALRSCFQMQKNNAHTLDIPCLEDLRLATEGRPTGAAARYFLARHYDEKNAVKEVHTLLSEIAAHYADDYYYYHLTERPLKEQMAWAKTFEAPSSREGKLLKALLMRDLTQAKDLHENSELKDFFKRTQKRMADLSHNQSLALLLLAADSRSEMRELLRSEKKPEIYETLFALGLLAKKSDIALFAIKQQIRFQKLRLFLFEIPLEVREHLYPTTYGMFVEKYAAENRLEKAEVFALIRQESQFFAGAISSAKAQGLMQIMPATGKPLAARAGLKTYSLLDPETNIRLGTSFMRDIKDNYAADFTGLAIAYNAGPGRLIQWKKKYSRDDDIFLEEVPFQETYHYLRILLADRALYRVLLNEK